MKQFAPYRHADGSNCWTKNCSRGTPTNVPTAESAAKAEPAISSLAKTHFGSATMTEEESLAESTRDLFFISATEKKALVYFSTENYDWINHALYNKTTLPSVRGSQADFGMGKVNTQVTSIKNGEEWFDPHVTPVPERTQEVLAETLATLDKALAKAPRSGVRTLFRGVQAEGIIGGMLAEEWAKKGTLVGDHLTFDGYQSASSSYSVASDTYASDRGSVIFALSTPEGVNISSISSYPEEQEVVLPRKSSYRVVGKYEEERKPGNIVTIVQLVAVNSRKEVLNERDREEGKKKSWLASLFSK